MVATPLAWFRISMSGAKDLGLSFDAAWDGAMESLGEQRVEWEAAL